MNRCHTDITDWPTRGYVHGAIDCLEQIHLARGHVSVIPAACRPASWRFPQLVYDVLNWWSMDESNRIAFLGFTQPPELIMMAWILERARMGRRELTSLDFQEVDYPRLTIACGQLAQCRIMAVPRGFPDARCFYAAAQVIVTKFGINRLLAHDRCLRNGHRLSQQPVPREWQTLSKSRGVELVLEGRTPESIPR